MKKLLFGLLLCLALVSCNDDNDKPQPAEMLVGSWEAVACEAMSMVGESVVSISSWNAGDPEGGVYLMSDWFVINRDGSGKGRDGKLTWILSGEVFRIMYGTSNNGFGYIKDLDVLELSSDTLVLEVSATSYHGYVDYEKVTFSRK